MQEHFKIQDNPFNIHEYISNKNYEDTEDFHPFQRRELMYAIKQQHNNKAPGYYSIDALVIKNLCRTYTPFVLKLFNTCLSLGHFPNAWKHGLIIFFRKRNKPPDQPRSYRPITILAILGKIYERLLKTRIMTQLEANNFLHPTQYGFREGRSTLSARSFEERS